MQKGTLIMRNTKKIMSIILLSILLNGCKSSEKIVSSISCKGKIIVQKEWLDKENEDRNHVISGGLHDGFTVKFVGVYKNDTLKIYIDNYLHSELKIDKSDNEDIHNYGFTFSHIKKPKIPVLKIESLKT